MTKINLLGLSVKKNAMILSVFALLSTATVALVHQLTKDKIKNEIQRVMSQQLNSLVPHNLYDNSPIEDCILLIDESSKEHSTLNNVSINKVFRMRKNNHSIAMVISSTAHDGYSGDINLLIALSNQDELIGVEVVSHTETPGLGDKIESRKSQWLQQFKNISLNSFDKKNWAVKKDGGDFDALTGATITPRAVVNAIYSTTEYYLLNKKILFSKNSNCIIDDK